MSILEDTAYMDATAQAELVQRGEVSPEELLEAAIERAERVHPQLNAVVTRMYDEARAAIQAGLPGGPFTGVPFLIKDLMAAYAGVPMKAGCKLMEDFVPRVDSELVARYKRAGLVIFGKTNTPEFGFQPTTESELYGRCHNPWNLDHTPGGSSGGSSAAVAAGVVPMGHANDGGGSIRIPAACCGLFGLKPTRGRISLGPAFGDQQNGLVNEHAVTRSVRDSAALLDAVEGFVQGDPYCAPAKARPYSEEVGAATGKLRIAFSATTYTGDAVHDDCTAAVRDVAKLCEDLGHDVVEAAPTIDGQGTARAFAAIWYAGAGLSIAGAAGLHKREPTSDDFEPLSWGLYEMSKKVSAADYLRAVLTLQRASRSIAGFMEGYDLFLTPTLGEPPAVLGTFDPTPENPMQGFFRAGPFSPFTAIFNGTGQPAMTVPLNWNDHGLPIGTHFSARFGDEATLFRLAAQLEEARPWADRRPPVTAAG